jgi:hypothetical protein
MDANQVSADRKQARTTDTIHSARKARAKATVMGSQRLRTDLRLSRQGRQYPRNKM